MKPPPFTYHQPATVEEAVSILSELGDEAKVLAGGQSLVPMLNLRLARPPHIVDIGRIPELRGMREDGGRMTVGAATTQREVERSDMVKKRQPLVAEAVRWIAHPPIRVRGTVGGSIAHADPAAELPAVALLLEAEMVAASKRGERAIAARDFFVTYLTSALEPDELLTEIRLPAWPGGASWGFTEISRRHGDFALAGAAAMLVLKDGTVGEARLALFGVAPTPVRAREAEALAAGQPAGPELWVEMANAALAAIDPPSDLHATAAYRRYVTAGLVERALESAAG